MGCARELSDLYTPAVLALLSFPASVGDVEADRGLGPQLCVDVREESSRRGLDERAELVDEDVVDAGVLEIGVFMRVGDVEDLDDIRRLRGRLLSDA